VPKKTVKLNLDKMIIKSNLYESLYPIFNQFNTYFQEIIDKDLKINFNEFNYQEHKKNILNKLILRYGLFITKKIEFGGE